MRYATNGFVIFSLLLFSRAIDFDSRNQFVIWNVGQGLSTTLIELNRCVHFDLGGEFSPQKHIKQLCYKKNNVIFLSHEDWDHINFVKQVARALPVRCLVAPHTVTKRTTKTLLQKIPPCSAVGGIQTLDLDFFKNSNESSRIISAETILLPGDSTIRMEKSWCFLMKGLEKIKILLLGHHGSRTSTSQELLNHLPRLKMAIASARQRRYGHPHLTVRQRLRKNRIPLLRTEDWGHIRIELRNSNE